MGSIRRALVFASKKIVYLGVLQAVTYKPELITKFFQSCKVSDMQQPGVHTLRATAGAAEARKGRNLGRRRNRGRLK